ncbi:MAG: alpha/beta hydrolase [Deltaproteobacteria bacterium]|nr:alpha/beta hydrolase [Deltaproteobacteria bacterium]
MERIQIDRTVPSWDGHGHCVLRVWTPPGYARETWRRYPVVYMQDGQNVFEHHASAPWHTWHANRAMERLVHEGRIEPWIIVAMDHGPARFDDYSPWPEDSVGSAGGFDRWARHLVDVVMPHVRRRWRTRPGAEWTATTGSSLGGMAALCLGWTRPAVFGRLGALSPSVMWAGGRLLREWTAHPRCWTRIYADAGETELFDGEGLRLDYGKAARELGAHLHRLGYAPWELMVRLEPGGQHSEADWARRLPHAWAWLLG